MSRSLSFFLRSFVIAGGATLAIGLAAPASGCQYTHAPDPVGDASARFIGGRMLDAATYVDLAVAERAEKVRRPDGRELAASAITYRVLRRLKGGSPDRFILFGNGIRPIDPSAKAAELGHWVDEAGRVEPFPYVREMPATGRSMITSCDPPDLQPTLGRTYLIFREADGRLLGPLVFHRGARAIEAFPIADVGVFADSSWARQIYHSAPPAPSRAGRPGDAAPAADDQHGYVTLRTPLSAEAASALAKSARAIPHSVSLTRGTTSAEYSLGPELASPRLFAEAVAWAGRSGTPPEAARELARQLASAYTAYDFETDGAKIANARDLLKVSALTGSGTPMITGFLFRGGTDARRALAASPAVQSVVPAIRVRERVGAPRAQLPPEEARAFPTPLQAAELHRRLSLLAGLAVSDADISGKWRLASVDTLPVQPGTLTLRLEGGGVSGTLACSPFEGGYELKGSVILFSTPKPSVARCQKADTTWLGEGFFENPAATVLTTGAELVLSRGNARYRFVRG